MATELTTLSGITTLWSIPVLSLRFLIITRISSFSFFKCWSFRRFSPEMLSENIKGVIWKLISSMVSNCKLLHVMGFPLFICTCSCKSYNQLHTCSNCSYGNKVCDIFTLPFPKSHHIVDKYGNSHSSQKQEIKI